MQTNGYAKIVLMIVLVLASAGCGQGGGQTAADGSNVSNPPNAAKVEDTFSKDPVTVTLLSNGAGINTDEDLNNIIVKPVHMKYPNITIQLVKGRSLNDIIASGDTPDLIATSNYYLYSLLQLGLGSDLNDFVKQQNIDLNRFEPETIKVLKQFGNNGELYGIPYSMNYGIMAYNKDIFDKFGVPYPKDQMTWSQVIELARKLTRESDGTNYIGLDPGQAVNLTRAYALPTVDDKKEHAVLTSDGYKKVFSMIRQIYDIPGMIDPKADYTKDNIDRFLKDQRVAMMPYWLDALTSRVLPLVQQGKNFNWDLVSYPSYDDRPGVGREVDFHLLMVTPTSKNKEAAYRVIMAMISDEAQMELNKGGSLTALKDPAIKKQFASNMKIYDGKNVSGIFSVAPGSLPKATEYDAKIYSFLGNAMKSVISNNTDINTALRDANEQAEKYIQEEKAK